MKFSPALSSGNRSVAAVSRRFNKSSVIAVLLFCALGLFALLFGAVIGLGSPFLLTLLAGAIFGILGFLLMDSYKMLVVVFVLTFVVQGSASSFLGNRQAAWVVVGLAVLFAVRAVLDRSFAKRRAEQSIKGAADSAVLVALLLYAIVFVTSALLNRPPSAQVIVAVKAAWPLMAVLLALAWFRWTPEQQGRLWKILVAVLFVQVPVVLYQHFVIAPTRIQAQHDAVVGTFGGTVNGGGNSALLVLFTVIVMSYTLARWDRGLVTARSMVTVCIVGVFVILLGEVKAVFIWAPLAFCFILRRRILRNVVSFVWYVILLVVLSGAVWGTYSALYWGANVSKKETVSDKLEASGGYFFDPKAVDYRTGEVGRGAALAIWAQDRGASTITRLVGYGPGAIKSGPGLGTGQLYRRFAPLQVDSTALSVLLWDIGILGALAYISFLGSIVMAGWYYLARANSSPAEMAMVEASLVAVLLLSSLIIYNRTLMDDPGVQLLLAFSAGTILQAIRFGALKRNEKTRSAHPATKLGLPIKNSA